MAALSRSSVVDLRLARVAVVAVVALQIGMINDFALGGRWVAPVLEVVLLIPLLILGRRSRRLAAVAVSAQDHERFARQRRVMTLVGITLLGIVSAANAIALLSLVQALLVGQSHTGRTLLIDAMNIWATTVIAFALWYWELDRGGPSLRLTGDPLPSDFLFAHSTVSPEHPAARRSPGFVDYLFLSFTTSTAFSPTDTLPLTRRMKLLMMLQASLSLLTIALVAARAVNILA